MKFLTILLLLCSFIISAQDLHTSVKNSEEQKVITLISKNPELIDQISASGYTPLMLSAYHNQYAITEILLEKGAKVNISSKYGSALMAAVVKGNKKIVKLLLDYKADPNTTDENKNTALLFSALFNQTEIADYLLAAGANPDHKDIRGNKALDYAIIKQNEALIKLLNQYK